MCFILF